MVGGWFFVGFFFGGLSVRLWVLEEVPFYFLPDFFLLNFFLPLGLSAAFEVLENSPLDCV